MSDLLEAVREFLDAKELHRRSLAGNDRDHVTAARRRVEDSELRLVEAYKIADCAHEKARLAGAL